MDKLTHNQVADSLAAHLRGNADRMVWTDTQLGPAGSPRPDVFTINKSYSRFASDAYEVKVSVSDLRHDLTEGKWQKYRKFAHRVWFAFPRGLAPITEVPRECGVILMGEGGNWRAARKPISQTLDTLPHDTWTKLLIEAHERSAEPQSLHDLRARAASDWRLQELLRKRAGEEAAKLFGDLQAARSHFEYETSLQRGRTEALSKSYEEDRARMKANLNSELNWLTGEMRGLATVLGIPEGQEVSPGQLCRAINGMRTRLEMGLVDRAITQLQSIKTEMQQAITGEQHA